MLKGLKMCKNGNIWTLCDKLVTLAFVSFIIAIIYMIGANFETIIGWIEWK